MRKNIFFIYILIGVITAFPFLNVSVGANLSETLKILFHEEIDVFIICNIACAPWIFCYHNIIAKHYPEAKYIRQVLGIEVLAFLLLALAVITCAVIKFGNFQGGILSGFFVLNFLVLYNIIEIILSILKNLNKKLKSEKI